MRSWPLTSDVARRSGRWRSEYIVDLDSRTLDGKILLNVHYYEQGNVQLSTTHTISLELPSTISSSSGTPSASASKILALIEAEENKYQTSLNVAYQQMGDKTFKGLRRALPMTRAKLDWDRVRDALIDAPFHRLMRVANAVGAGVQTWRGIERE